MYPTGQCKCLQCGEFYRADARNRKRQKYCRKPECVRASKRASQRRWLGKKENQDYFKGPENGERVRAWRKAHPGYWRKKRAVPGIALQEILKSQVAAPKQEAKQDAAIALQDLLRTQDPLVLGLMIHLTDPALKEDIVGMTQRLITQGRAAMG